MRRVLVVLAVAAALPGVASAATLSRADRAQIDRLMDVFVPAGVGRVGSERAWALATPAMHFGSSRADWAKGTLPVQPFPVKGTSFHAWTVDHVGRNAVDISLLVHLKPGADFSGVAFAFSLRKLHGRWLVDTAQVAATFAAQGQRSKILAANDFGPGNTPDPYSSTKQSLHGRISSAWLIVIPAILVGLVVLVPAGIFTGLRVRDRRAYRRSLATRV